MINIDRKKLSVEFPAVLLNTCSGEIDDEFHVYVQPQENPTLSEFCRQLTGITQEVVDEGLPLSICLRRFNTWLTTLASTKNILYNVTDVTEGKSTCSFATWSDWDLGVCLLYECRRKQLRKPTQLNSWIDLRATYRTFYGRRPHGLNGALQEIGFTFEGREHSGLHDARNTARLTWKMICDGCVLNITKTIADNSKQTIAVSPGTSCALTCQPVVPAVSASDMVPADSSSTSKSSPRTVTDEQQTPHRAISGNDTTGHVTGSFLSDIRSTSSVTIAVTSDSFNATTSAVTSVTMCSVADCVTRNKQSPRTVCSKSLDTADRTVTDAAAASVCGDSCDDLILSEVGFNVSDWLMDDSLFDNNITVDGEHSPSKQQGWVQQGRVQQDRCNSLVTIQHRRVLKDITNSINNNNNNMSTSCVHNNSVSVNQSTVKQFSCSRSLPLTSKIVVTSRQPVVTPRLASNSLIKSGVSQPMVTPRGPLNNVLHQSCVLQSTITARSSIINTCLSTNASRLSSATPRGPLTNTSRLSSATPRGPLTNTSRLSSATPRGPLTNTLSTSVSQSMITPRGPLNVTCQTSSNASTMKATAPMCDCGCRAKRKFVQTPGPNSGRSFFCCGLRSTKRCGFFKWELQSSGNPNISNSSSMFNNTSSWHSTVCDTPVLSHCNWGNSSRVLVPPSLNYNTPKT